MENGDVAVEVVQIANRLNWKRESTVLASTGSIYIELSREENGQKEWVHNC